MTPAAEVFGRSISPRSQDAGTPTVGNGTSGGRRASVVSQGSSVQHVMPLVLDDPTLLRGTTLPQLVSGWGEHFQESGSPDKVSLAHMSREVSRLDEFMSHVWRDRRRSKILCLLLYYNGFPAAVNAIAASALAFALTYAGVLQPWTDQNWIHNDETITEGVSHWSTVSGIPVFLLSLMCWHHVPACLGGGNNRSIFFDKFCIDQCDLERQNLGIQSLSAFIAHSDRFLMLWSPHYFTRLWCTFEVATFVHIQRSYNQDSMLRDTRHCMAFRPLYVSAITLSVMASFQFSTLAFNVASSMTALYEVPPMSAFILSQILPGLVLSPLHMHVLKKYARTRHNLQHQLAHFEIESAVCHKDDDRTIIYSTIEHWFGNRDNFNTLVRTDVSKLILATLPSGFGVPINLCGYSMLPLLFSAFDWSASYMRFDDKSFALSSIFFAFSLPLVPILMIDLWVRVANTPFAMKERVSPTWNGINTCITSLPPLMVHLLFITVGLMVIRPLGPLLQFAFGASLLTLICITRGSLSYGEQAMRRACQCLRRCRGSTDWCCWARRGCGASSQSSMPSARHHEPVVHAI